MQKIICSAIAVVMVGIGLLSPGQAMEKQARHWPSASMKAQHVLPPCTCRALGRQYFVGESICLNARRAICGMDLNVTTWSMTDEGCATSARQTAPVL